MGEEDAPGKGGFIPLAVDVDACDDDMTLLGATGCDADVSDAELMCCCVCDALVEDGKGSGSGGGGGGGGGGDDDDDDDGSMCR